MSDPHPFLIRRASAPGWIHDHSVPGEPRIYDALGEQAEWGFALPWVYRALASPVTREPIPEAPAPGVQEVNGPVGYWSALLHLLVYGLGWVRPDHGMRWWYDSGKPTVDRILRFVAHVWDADGQLDWFAAWLWSIPRLLEPELLKDATGYQGAPFLLVRDGRDPLAFADGHGSWLEWLPATGEGILKCS
jgi:hypothetical protein